MEGAGVLIVFTLRLFDAVLMVLDVTRIIFIGLPAVLRHGIGYWTKDRNRQDDRF